MSPPRSPTHSFRQNLLSGLTKIAHASTPFITTFVLIHLTAPALGNLGGSSLSSQTMLLGREYYQTDFGEKYLVVGPLVVHSLAAIAKRLLSPHTSASRPLSSFLGWTGYATALFFLPIHFTTHRLYPTSTSFPISGVGPAELDYEFVKVGLQTWPLTSWFLYAGLVGSVALHMVDGTAIIWNTWLRNTVVDVRSKIGGSNERLKKLIKALVGLVIPVLTGLYAISKEPPMIFSSAAQRFEAVFTKSWLYRTHF